MADKTIKQSKRLRRKYMINKPNKCVEEMFEGIANIYPGLCIDTNRRIVFLNRVKYSYIVLN